MGSLSFKVIHPVTLNNTELLFIWIIY